MIPVYVAETANKDLRSSMNNVANITQVTKPFSNFEAPKWTICQNVGYVLLYLFSLHLPWRPLAALLLAFPAIALACLLPLPETPYWLARWETCNFIPVIKLAFLSPRLRYLVHAGRVAWRRQGSLWPGWERGNTTWRRSMKSWRLMLSNISIWWYVCTWNIMSAKWRNRVEAKRVPVPLWQFPLKVCTGQADSGVGMLKGLRSLSPPFQKCPQYCHRHHCQITNVTLWSG